jgi:hypothetical protein
MPIRKTPATSHFILIAGALQGETPFVYGGFLLSSFFSRIFAAKFGKK